MDDPVRWESKPDLREPVLICAFKGWNDAAESASLAISYLADKWDAQQFATLDPDEFFDFQVNRPTVKLTEGRSREIEWPEVVLSSASMPGTDRDAVLLVGAEPNLRWRSFSETIVSTVQAVGVEMVVSLGALLADVPHTRPVQITGLASDADLIERLGFSETRYQGPTGITGIVHDACARAGLRSASLWAPVPHYVAAVSSPKAARALMGRLQEILGFSVDTEDLDGAAAEYERRLDDAVEREPEVRQLVERLEQQMDEQEVSFRDLPSGDSIAREFQRYLRDKNEDD
jgi:predicted ATP-grasp superfamily ATP-dependent carboligase